MGLFDFLKSKKNPLDDPQFRPLMIRGMAEQLATKCDNLKAIGRETDAKTIALKFLADQFQQTSSPEFRNTSAIYSALAYAAIKLGQPQAGKTLLDAVIAAHESVRAKNGKGSFVDLTQLYIEAGRLAHQIRNIPDEEYRCFWFATEEKPPVGCKEPATSRQKAIAHTYAYSIAAVTSRTTEADEQIWNQRANWHDTKRRELIPDLDWDDTPAIIAWLKGSK